MTDKELSLVCKNIFSEGLNISDDEAAYLVPNFSHNVCFGLSTELDA